MKSRISFTAIVLLALMTPAALAAMGPNINQNIDQSASQIISGSTINNSTINQSIAQTAGQSAVGTGFGSNVNADQNIDQGASQSIQGSSIIGSSVGQMIDQGASRTARGIGNATGFTSSQNVAQTANQSLQGISLSNASLSQNIIQGANQSFTWNNQSYFTMNDQTITMTANQRAALMPSINDFLVSYPNNRMFIMPLTDLSAFNDAGRRDVTVLNVGFGAIPYGFSSLPLITIPINQLAARIGEIPLGTTIAVMGDNDMASATAATLLRMQGYNAWAVRTGTC